MSLLGKNTVLKNSNLDCCTMALKLLAMLFITISFFSLKGIDFLALEGMGFLKPKVLQEKYLLLLLEVVSPEENLDTGIIRLLIR